MRRQILASICVFIFVSGCKSTDSGSSVAAAEDGAAVAPATEQPPSAPVVVGARFAGVDTAGAPCHITVASEEGDVKAVEIHGNVIDVDNFETGSSQGGEKTVHLPMTDAERQEILGSSASGDGANSGAGADGAFAEFKVRKFLLGKGTRLTESVGAEGDGIPVLNTIILEVVSTVDLRGATDAPKSFDYTSKAKLKKSLVKVPLPFITNARMSCKNLQPVN